MQDLAPPPPPLIPLPMEGIVPPPVPRDLQVVANLPTPDGSDKVDLNPSDSYPRVPKRNNASLLTGVLDSPPPSAPQGRPSPTQEQRTAEWSSTQQHYPPASSKRRRKNEEPGASSDSRKPE
ncbi:hypothetical protein BD410DRAFT_784402 [Rickenella mellea]|uniref:Uncharacterized protein n=1 Tax=Rickenella mellea TaxID=50990 RepID=A0A4Y7QF76_9AGAM|nr:hypothetical protein BD410DRAFT_784402 [Rickenella mellea]